MKFSIKDFLSKCDQIRRKLQIWSYLLKKSLVENFIWKSYAQMDASFLFGSQSLDHSLNYVLDPL